MASCCNKNKDFSHGSTQIVNEIDVHGAGTYYRQEIPKC
jgi:hypothetical protein